MKTYTLEQFKKFAKEIEAYENGEEIEIYNISRGVWVYHKVHNFFTSMSYRVKPKLSREEITANWVKENNLKIGDKVKVLKGFEDGIFGIKKGLSDIVVGKLAVVNEIKTDRICIGFKKDTWSLPVECLEKVKEEYVPFTLEDRNLFLGKAIKVKEFDEFFIITYAGKEKAGFDGSYYEYEELLEDYEFEDGTPFGKLKL